MPAFHYVAANQKGKEEKGVLEADSDKHARDLIRQKGLLPLTIKPARQGKKHAASWWQQKRLSVKELALITRQFATLLSAGLPIEESLAAVAEQTEKAKIKSLVLSVRAKVLEGHALAAALRDYPDAFSALYCATVAAGEKTGHLDKVLLRLADYTEQQSALKQKLTTALIYPSMIVLVAIGIVGFLLEYVVPKMVAVYGNLKQALPTMTTILISMSQFVQHYGLIIILLLALLIATFFYMLKRQLSFRLRVHAFLLKLPLIGYAIRTSNTARFARTVAILSASGVPALEAMNISAELITNLPIRNAVQQAVNRVREGAAIHLALKQTAYFSPMSVHMIASGEASGQLEPMLERVAHNQEEEIVRLIDVALALFEPAVIMVMGATVLFIVLAVLLPIFQLNEFTG